MSQRLLITLKKNYTHEDSFYDAVYTEEGSLKTLMVDWCCYNCHTGTYLGPWRITIRDHDIFDQFMEDFVKMKKYIPELQSLKDCWTVYTETKDETYRNKKLDIEMGTIIQAVIEKS